MSTDIRPEVSKKNEYWIPKHRYYELKHFVKQYPDWVRYLREFDGKYPNPLHLEVVPENKLCPSDPTEEEVEKREHYHARKDLVDVCLWKAYDDVDDRTLQQILQALVNGWSYDVLKVKHNIPLSKDYYYIRYRKFFWLLDKTRK